MSEQKAGKLLETAHLACERAMKAGAAWCDVVVSSGSDVAVLVENGSVRTAETVSNRAVSVRAFVRGGRGICSSHGFEEADVQRCAEQAAAMAKAAQADPDFVSLPGVEPAEKVGGLYDEAIARMTVEEVVEIAVRNIDEARQVCPEVILMGDVGKSVSETALVNSAGVSLSRHGSHLDVSFHAIVRKDDDAGSFFDFDTGRKLEDVQPYGLGRSATEMAMRFLGARKMRSAVLPVVLGPLASFSLLGSIAGSASAENIQRRRSFMVGQLGKKIGSEVLTLVDDGLVPRGLRSSSHDGEGAARQRVTILENGVFAGMLHNSYTAGKAKASNTGHGSQGAQVSPTNLRPATGRATAEEIIADVKEGLYMNIGSLNPDPVSGDISASVDFGFKIENGKLAYPVMNTMLSGHIFEVLDQVDAVSSDYREEPGNILPTMRIRAMQVAGAD